MTQRKVKFALVGFGHIGKRHAEMISKNPQAELMAIADSDPAKSDTGYPVPFFSSASEMLNAMPDIEVVNIATPNGYHPLIALECIEAGKHVVIEKPMALHKADAEKIIFKALEKQRQVFVVMQNRYSPPSKWIKNLIENQTLGKIYQVQLNCYWNRDERYYKKGSWHGTSNLDGGTLYTQFSHFIDIMYWLFGDIDQIQARFENFNHQGTIEFEDSGLISFRFANGALGCLNYSTAVWDSNLESSMTIIAEKGSVKIGGQYMDKVEVCHIKDYQMPELPPTNPGNDYGAYKGSAQNHQYVVQNVIDVINGNSVITTNALEGLKVVEIIERIYQKKQ